MGSNIDGHVGLLNIPPERTPEWVKFPRKDVMEPRGWRFQLSWYETDDEGGKLPCFHRGSEDDLDWLMAKANQLRVEGYSPSIYDLHEYVK